MLPDTPSARIVGLYERHAKAFDRDRGKTLIERPWLDRFLAELPAGRLVLDVGCGTGEPIARYLLQSGCRVVGVDSARSMIEICRTRFPQAEWHVGDMRQLAFRRTFDGIVAWDSFFHLTADDQRGMFRRFGSQASPGAALMFTSGSAAGEAIGEYCGEPLFHASLDPAEYEDLLESNGFTVVVHLTDDPDCGHHTVWLARRRA